jgi:hypothetical protein
MNMLSMKVRHLVAVKPSSWNKKFSSYSAMARHGVAVAPSSFQPKANTSKIGANTSSTTTVVSLWWWWIVVVVSGGGMLTVGFVKVHAWQSRDLSSTVIHTSTSALSAIAQQARKKISSPATTTTIRTTAAHCSTLCEEHHPQSSSSSSWKSKESSVITTDSIASSIKINAKNQNNNNKPDRKTRTFQNPVDLQFRANGGIQLPRPSVMHAVLSNDKTVLDSDCDDGDCDCHGIFVIGDVHGCYEEMIELVNVAMHRHNDGREFCHVILVGDLCNKGPQSVAVLRHVQQHSPRWRAVRGNHDDATLKAALNMGWETHEDHTYSNKSNPTTFASKKYQWIQTEGLSDSDVEWMSELPYSIRITGQVLGESIDTLIVHAGLVPNRRLDEQTIETMINMRDVTVTVISNDETGNEIVQYAPAPKLPQQLSKDVDGEGNHKSHDTSTIPWASAWSGPEHVIFGHDAKRGLQQHSHHPLDGNTSNNGSSPAISAVGLDTGCVYGKRLTGIVLPSRTIVQVDAKRVYSPINASKPNSSNSK